MNLMGLDLSLTATGIAITPEAPHTFKPKGKGDDRLVEIRDEVLRCALGGKVEQVMIENVPPYGKGTAALTLVHGVVRESLRRHRIDAFYVFPSTLKKWATGDGGATKGDMAEAFDYDFDMDRKALKLDDNAVDAQFLLAILIASRNGGLPQEVAEKIRPIK